MIRLSDKVKLIFAILGAITIVVSMYLILLLKLRINFGRYFYLL